MTLWMSKLDEHGRPKESTAKCTVCGAQLIRSVSNRRKYCDPCAKAAARHSSREWNRLNAGPRPGRLLN